MLGCIDIPIPSRLGSKRSLIFGDFWADPAGVGRGNCSNGVSGNSKSHLVTQRVSNRVGFFAGMGRFSV